MEREKVSPQLEQEVQRGLTMVGKGMHSFIGQQKAKKGGKHVHPLCERKSKTIPKKKKEVRYSLCGAEGWFGW